MVKVLTYGTFDLFHIGHLRLLQRAKMLGDELIVGVSTDDFNVKKGKKSFIPYQDRRDIVRAVKGVSLVIPEEDWNQKERDISAYNIDLMVMGDDWIGKFDYLKRLCDVQYLERTEGISSSFLKARLASGRNLNKRS